EQLDFAAPGWSTDGLQAAARHGRVGARIHARLQGHGEGAVHPGVLPQRGLAERRASPERARRDPPRSVTPIRSGVRGSRLGLPGAALAHHTGLMSPCALVAIGLLALVFSGCSLAARTFGSSVDAKLITPSLR